MPNPRKVVEMDDTHFTERSYLVDGVTLIFDATANDGHAAVGRAVSLSAAKTVQLASDGEAVIGELVRVEADGIAVVKDHGILTLPGGNGATLTLGTSIVGALGASSAKGYVRSVNTAVAAELGKCKGRILDAADATKVKIQF